MNKKIIIGILIVLGIIIVLLVLLGEDGGELQSNWVKYPKNPVLRKDLGNWYEWGTFVKADPVVIKDKEENKYKMWFSCIKMIGAKWNWSTFAICYAESSDGINWIEYEDNPVLELTDDGWEHPNPNGSGLETPFVMKDNGIYKMWHQTFDSENMHLEEYPVPVIGYITSTDGIHWGDPSKPGLGKIKSLRGSYNWDNVSVSDPHVIRDDEEPDPNKRYKIWYHGIGWEDWIPRIGYAYSPDGINWTEYEGNPVLDLSISGWDKGAVAMPSVIKRNGIYEMWYGGSDRDWKDVAAIIQTGYAWSKDGINWHKYDKNPVITVSHIKDHDGDPWETSIAAAPTVILDGDLYKMWYEGTVPYWEYLQIGYAEKKMEEQTIT